MDNNHTAALILAAGYSSRMGRFKPLLPLGSGSVIQRTINLFFDSGIYDVRVVVGHRCEELIPEIAGLGAQWVVNHNYNSGMFSSIQAGVKSLEPEKRGFFLLPVDIPLVRRSTVMDLLMAFKNSEADVFRPCFAGRYGHPPLIGTTLSPSILAWKGDGGLRSLLSRDDYRFKDVEVSDEHIHLDMDSPGQYEKILGKLADYHIPSREECLAILTRKFSVNESLSAHSKKVAEVAVLLAGSLNISGCRLNLKLVEAAALLHDLAKGKKNHAAVAAALLRQMDFPAVEEIVDKHMAKSIVLDQEITERDVVCLADRLIRDDRVVGLEDKYLAKMDEYAGDSAACGAISDGLAASTLLKRKIEDRLGRSVESVLNEKS